MRAAVLLIVMLGLGCTNTGMGAKIIDGEAMLRVKGCWDRDSAIISTLERYSGGILTPLFTISEAATCPMDEIAKQEAADAP